MTKILLDKQDRLKEGGAILCDSLFIQEGIVHKVHDDDENMIIIIYTREFDNKNLIYLMRILQN